MELKKTKIPNEFLLRLPEGLKILSRHGHEFLVVEDIRGPKGESLMSKDVRIHGEATVRIGIKIGETEGLIFFDAFWGSHAKLYSFLPKNLEKESIAVAFVPETHESLMVDRDCEIDACDCKKAFALRLPRDNNVIYVCAKLGCPGHAIDINNLPKTVVQETSNINFFGECGLDDDWFDTL